MAVKLIDPCHDQTGYTSQTTSLALHSRILLDEKKGHSYKVVEGPPPSFNKSAFLKRQGRQVVAYRAMLVYTGVVARTM